MLQSQAETTTEVSTSKNSGWKVGVGIGVSDSGSGGGINVFASGFVGSGKAHGNGTTHRETQVSARDNLALISGRDTLLEGAQARADRIRADIGRNLTLASQQDSDRYDAKQKQVNAGGSFSFGSMTGNAYLGASVGKTKSNYDSVVEQTGLFAGAGGYDIHVGKHTQLDGAVVASDADTATNQLSTETLGFRDIHNKAQYKSTTVGINLGMSGAFDKPNKGAALGAGPSGLSFASTSGSETGTTRAAVSAGTLAVRSDAGTGRDSTAGLSRDTAGSLQNGSIGEIFEKDKVREQLEFLQAFGQLGMQIAGDVADGLMQDDAALWGEGQPGRVALHAGIAGVGAALGGGNVFGALTGTVAGDVATDLIREQIDRAVAGLPMDAQAQVANAVINVIASAAGGVVGGISGAGGASNADVFNRQLHNVTDDELKRKAAELASNPEYAGLTEQELYYAIRFVYRNDQIGTGDLRSFDTLEAAKTAGVVVTYDQNNDRWVEDPEVILSRLGAGAGARAGLDSKLREYLWDAGGLYQKELIDANTRSASIVLDLAVGGLTSRVGLGRKAYGSTKLPGAGSVVDVNPTKSGQNCTNCAYVVDNQLATGSKASALPRSEPIPFSELNRLYSTKMSGWTNRKNIEDSLLSAGDGTRAVIYGADPHWSRMERCGEEWSSTLH